MKYPNSLTSKRFRYSLAVLPFLFTGLLQADINTGLVAHYEFEGDTNDTTSNEYHLSSDISNVSFATGKFSQGADFGSGGIRIKTADSALTQSNTVTYSFWMQKSPATELHILSTYATPPSGTWDTSNALFSSSTELGVGSIASPNYSTSISGAHFDGTWHHVAIVSDGTNVEFFLDGVSKGTVTQTLTLESTLYLGDFGSGKNYSGLMDDFRIYNRALNATDVTELFNYTPPLTLTGTSGIDILTGDSNNDTLYGLDGDDTLNGLGGDDILIGGAGDDTLDGGMDNDIVDYSAATSGITLDLSSGSAQTIGGGQGDDTLSNIENVIGSEFDDTIIGDTSNNLLNGGTGDDTLNGKAGNDYLDGGDGEDTLILSGNQADYTIVENQDTTYTVTGTDGTDTIINIELVSFNDVQSVDITTIAQLLPKLTLKAHGGALQFPVGPEHNIALPDFTFDTNGTLEAWVKTTGIPAYTRVIDIGNSTFTISLDAANKVYNDSAQTDNPIPSNVWTHLSVVKNGTDTKIFINGELSKTATGNVLNGTYTSNLIHATNAGDNTQTSIELDEVRIWNTARTQSDINSTMNQQLDGNETGLIAYYNFDERVGDTVYDISGNNNTATMEGNVTRLNFLGDTLNFNGSSTSVDIGDDNQEGLAEFTTSAWIKYNTLNSSNYIISKSAVADMTLNNAGNLVAQIGDGTYMGSTCESDEVLSANNYHHVAFSYIASSNEVNLFIDGENVKTCTSNKTMGSSSYHRVIGATDDQMGQGNYVGYFDGIILEASIWDTALVQNEIQNLMASAPDTTDTNLVGYWPLNEGSGATTAKDYKGTNDGTITGATWTDTSPTIYGDTVYATIGTTTTAKLAWENFNYEPMYSVENNVSAPVILTDNTIIYTPDNTIPDMLKFSAEASGETAELNINFISYTDQMSTSSVTLNLYNVNLTEHNITNIFIIDADNFNGDINNTNAISVNNAASLLGSGTTTFTEDISYANYSLAFETDMNSYWFYNQTDGKLYPMIDQNSENWVLDNNQLEISLGTEQWQETTSPTYQGLFIPIFQYALTSIQYSDTNAQPLDMSSYYFVETYLDSNSDQILRIDKIIPQISDNKIYSIATQTKQDGTISSIEQEEDPITISTNTVSLQENGTDIFELKLASTLDNNALDSLYSASNGIDINVTFPNDSIGYELYEKEFLTQCHTWQQSNYNTPYTDLATFKTAYTYDAQNQNVLQYSKHSNYKMIQFANDGSNDIVEYDSQNLTLNTVGTWSELSNQVCKDESTNTSFTSSSIIKLNLTVDGYQNIAFIKNSNNEYIQGEYIQAGTTIKKYALNDTAAKYLASEVGLNTIPTLAFPITNQWTYLSLPTNNTLCTSDFQSELTNICDQNNTINALFANVDMVLKYSDSWSYWEPMISGTYNMNKFGSINHKEGLLVKATNQTTLNLPYDIFSLYPEKSYPIYTQGWYLGANAFDMKPSDIKTNVDANTSFTLKYILQLNKTNNWKVYAPLNNNEVNNDIERINTLETMKSFWIYAE